MQSECPDFEKSKSTFLIIGCDVDLKSIVTNEPTDEAIWSRSPHGLPKNTFSLYCATLAISTGLIFPSL